MFRTNTFELIYILLPAVLVEPADARTAILIAINDMDDEAAHQDAGLQCVDTFARLEADTVRITRTYETKPGTYMLWDPITRTGQLQQP